jgi:hypothetical protein
LGALLESPTTLNTNAQTRRFGVERLHIVFLSPSLEICISFGPCRTKYCFLMCSICKKNSSSANHVFSQAKWPPSAKTSLLLVCQRGGGGPSPTSTKCAFSKR